MVGGRGDAPSARGGFYGATQQGGVPQQHGRGSQQLQHNPRQSGEGHRGSNGEDVERYTGGPSMGTYGFDASPGPTCSSCDWPAHRNGSRRKSWL